MFAAVVQLSDLAKCRNHRLACIIHFVFTNNCNCLLSGLTASQNGTISVAHNATAEQREIAREAMLSVIGQADGTLTIAADGEMPERDIPVYIILLG